MNMKQINLVTGKKKVKKVRGLSVHLLACVLLLNFKVLPKFQVLDSIVPCCSSSVATYHLHLYILGGEKKVKSNLIIIVAFFLLFLKPCSFLK